MGTMFSNAKTIPKFHPRSASSTCIPLPPLQRSIIPSRVTLPPACATGYGIYYPNSFQSARSDYLCSLRKQKQRESSSNNQTIKIDIWRERERERERTSVVLSHFASFRNPFISTTSSNDDVHILALLPPPSLSLSLSLLGTLTFQSTKPVLPGEGTKTSRRARAGGGGGRLSGGRGDGTDVRYLSRSRNDRK